MSHSVSEGGVGSWWLNDIADLARIGEAIRNNTNLQQLTICFAHELAYMAADNGAFFEGIRSNTSKNDLWLENCDLSGRDILNRSLANNSNLTRGERRYSRR